MTRILIVDDHELVRTGLRNLLQAVADVEVVAEAASGEEALQLSRRHAPDVILMDIELPGLSGLETTERILAGQPESRVVVLTAHGEPPMPSRLLEVGAAGFLTKSCSSDELIEAIRSVARGQRYVGAAVAQQLALSVFSGTPESPFEGLTLRELEVAMMLTQGMSTGAIAKALNRSPKTVTAHKQNVFQKTGVRSAVELLRLAIRYGLDCGR